MPTPTKSKKLTRQQKIRRLKLFAFLLALVVPAILCFAVPDYAGLWLSLQLFVLIAEYIVLTSIYILGSHDMLVSLSSFHRMTYRGTYISGTFAEARRRPAPGQTADHESLKMIKQRKTYRGFCGTNVVFLLWPIWTAIRFPTTGIPVRIHATRIYTKDAPPRSPSVPIEADTTMIIRLAPDLESFLTTFELEGRSHDLTEKVVVHDNKWRPDQEDPTAHCYEGPILAQIMLNATESTILEAVRMMGNRYPWMGDHDVRGSIKDYETRVLGHLARWESLFQQAGLLLPQEEPDPDAPVEIIIPGPAALSIDFNIEEIDVEDENVRNSLGRPLTEANEAEAQENIGDGIGRRLKKIHEKGKVSSDTAVQLEALKAIGGQVNFYGAGDKVTDLVRSLLGK